MESSNKLTMCRLCLCENECFINIFEVDDRRGYVASEAIFDLLQFHVSATDGYPHVVCPMCLAKLRDFKMFKERCQMSKVIYDNVFNSEEKPVEQLTETDLAQKAEADRVDIAEDLDRHFQMANAAADRTAPPEGLLCSQVLTTRIAHDLHASGNRFSSNGVPVPHADGRPYKCKECSATFRRSGYLKLHAALHSGTKPYRCEKCDVRFSRVDYLRSHLKSHSGDNPRTGDSGNRRLRRHTVSATGTATYKCDKCEVSYGQRDLLKRHLRVHADYDSNRQRVEGGVLPNPRALQNVGGVPSSEGARPAPRTSGRELESQALAVRSLRQTIRSLNLNNT